MIWIILIVTGLVFDIVAAYVIVKAILRVKPIFINDDIINRMRKRDPRIDEMAEKSNQDANFIKKQKYDAKIGIILFSIGFGMQIVGNIVQYFYQN